MKPFNAMSPLSRVTALSIAIAGGWAAAASAAPVTYMSTRTILTPASKSITSAACRCGAAISRRRAARSRWMRPPRPARWTSPSTRRASISPTTKLNEHVSGPEILDVAKFPTATYKGTLGGFSNGAPTTVTGNLTLHGVTKPVALTINSFKCIQHPCSRRKFAVLTPAARSIVPTSASTMASSTASSRT